MTEKAKDDPERSSLQLGIIGNCSFSALVNQRGRIVWCCLPRLDSPPLFGRLLMGDEPPACERGFFDIDIDGFESSHQEYVKNTAILTTRLVSKDGSVLKITDFAPRFFKERRWFCPGQFIRILTPEKGRPRISVRCRPSDGYTGAKVQHVMGSNHISYFTSHHNTRLTSTIPVDFIEAESKFVVSKEYVMFYGVDEPFRGDLHNTKQEFLDATLGYWNTFTRNLQVPLEWQSDVIRSAITLKMCQLQTSGAIVAAMTTSIPESKDSGRNWDYRFCWLRDSFHTVQALNQLGQTTTMEQYLEFIVNIASDQDDDLQPLYGLLLEKEVKEYIIDKECMAGYRGMGPVRIGNEAYTQIQNDNYGNVVLSVQQMFFDERLSTPGTEHLFAQLETLGRRAIAAWNTHDAGLWELRNSKHVHTFSAAMNWAACHRLSLIAVKLKKQERADFWASEAKTMREAIIERAWDEERQCMMATLLPENTDDDEKESTIIQRELDASVLLLAYLQFFEPTDEKFIKTVETVGKELMHGDFCFRYVSADDFGKPDNSFIVCTFWYIEALALIGRKQEARELFQRLLKHRNHVGLFSEDITLKTNELWGNFPQTYSMVGIINNAIRLSEPWSSIGL